MACPGCPPALWDNQPEGSDRGWNGERARDRTWDLLVKSQLLYRLSYAPTPLVRSIVSGPQPRIRREHTQWTGRAKQRVWESVGKIPSRGDAIGGEARKAKARRRRRPCRAVEHGSTNLTQHRRRWRSRSREFFNGLLKSVGKIPSRGDAIGGDARKAKARRRRRPCRAVEHGSTNLTQNRRRWRSCSREFFSGLPRSSHLFGSVGRGAG